MLYAIMDRKTKLLARVCATKLSVLPFHTEEFIKRAKEPALHVGIFDTGTIFTHENLDVVKELIDERIVLDEGMEGIPISLAPHMDTTTMEIVVLPTTARLLGSDVCVSVS